MQNNSHAVADWFSRSTAECIGLMLNPKTNANLCPLPAWFPKHIMIRYALLQTWKASQPPQAISLAVMDHMKDLFFTSLTRMTVTELRLSHHI